MSPQHHPHWDSTEHAGDIRVNQRIKSATKKTTHKAKMMTGVWDLMVRCWETRLELLIVWRWMWLLTRPDHWWLTIFVICAVCRLPGAPCIAVWVNKRNLSLFRVDTFQPAADEQESIFDLLLPFHYQSTRTNSYSILTLRYQNICTVSVKYISKQIIDFCVFYTV